MDMKPSESIKKVCFVLPTFNEADNIRSTIESIFLEKNVLSILDIMKDSKFIFNVGHGLTPDCKINNVKKVIDIVRNYK